MKLQTIIDKTQQMDALYGDISLTINGNCVQLYIYRILSDSSKCANNYPTKLGNNRCCTAESYCLYGALTIIPKKFMAGLKIGFNCQFQFQILGGA